jgi:hypothetical protein
MHKVVGVPLLEPPSYLNLQKKLMDDFNDASNTFVTSESLLTVTVDLLQYVV